MPHSLDVNRIGEVIESIMDSPDYDRKLNAWEMDFMDNVKESFSRDGQLSERRMEILEGIYQKI